MMANHFKRAGLGDIVTAAKFLPYLAGEIPKGTRGEIRGVEVPGKVFRVRFYDYGFRVTEKDDLNMALRVRRTA